MITFRQTIVIYAIWQFFIQRFTCHLHIKMSLIMLLLVKVANARRFITRPYYFLVPSPFLERRFKFFLGLASSLASQLLHVVRCYLRHRVPFYEVGRCIPFHTTITSKDFVMPQTFLPSPWDSFLLRTSGINYVHIWVSLYDTYLYVNHQHMLR